VTDLYSLDHFEREVLAAWQSLSCTRGGRPTTADRALLRSLYAQGVSLSVIHAAFRLASARRSPDLPPVRSIAYFRTLIDELKSADPDYIDYLIARA
jgi:hypothetical protein